MTDTRFLVGVLAGVAIAWAWQHYVAPMPGPNRAAKRGAGG